MPPVGSHRPRMEGTWRPDWSELLSSQRRHRAPQGSLTYMSPTVGDRDMFQTQGSNSTLSLSSFKLSSESASPSTR